jgi:hypothetical protein
VTRLCCFNDEPTPSPLQEREQYTTFDKQLSHVCWSTQNQIADFSETWHVNTTPEPNPSRHDYSSMLNYIHSFIPLACAECGDSLPFSGASSVLLCLTTMWLNGVCWKIYNIVHLLLRYCFVQVTVTTWSRANRFLAHGCMVMTKEWLETGTRDLEERQIIKISNKTEQNKTQQNRIEYITGSSP